VSGEAGGTAVELYVLNSNLYSGVPSVAVFARHSNGNVAPERTIAGPDTGMNTPGGIAVDATGRVYVSDYAAGTYGAIFVYASGAEGDAPPVATITNGLADPCGVAVDDAGNVYEANFESDSINEYVAGTYQLVRTITSTAVGYCTGLAVGRSGKIYLLVGDYSGARPIGGDSSSYDGYIAVFSAQATGRTKPLRIIEGPETGLTDPLGIAVDARERIFVTNTKKEPARHVLVFGARAHGNAAPQYEIAGGKTQLVGPNGIALDKSGAIFVTNFSYVGKQSILGYAAGSRGDVAPSRKIRGRKAQLQTFTYIAVK
jgi:hypothetical protein